MDMAQLICGRRTIQNFSQEKVPDAVVMEALRLSLWVPNHRLTFPWHYVVVGDQTRQRLAELQADFKAQKAPLTATERSATLATVLNPSHLIMLGLKLSGDAAVDKENYATLACSVQTLSLVLWQSGIGVKWSTGKFTVHQKAYEILALSPETIRLEGCLFIGKPAQTPPARPRPNLEQVVFRI